jgi:hypothetical protein
VSARWAQRLAEAVGLRAPGAADAPAPVCLACRPFRLVPGGAGAAEPPGRPRESPLPAEVEAEPPVGEG